MVEQHLITLPPFKRGVYLITPYINEIDFKIKNGILNLFLMHTSASLAINENYDPSVRRDIETFLKTLIPDCWEGFTHILEGCDDMSAHMKNIFIGSSLTLPIKDGSLYLGVWQGIYLLEHREGPHKRKIFLSAIGE
ncbi:MAG: YjbQ family protein [Epsilonproteobacteria bacterium]|nr:YjbQ family protein [Campylobacterota bacterium]